MKGPIIPFVTEVDRVSIVEVARGPVRALSALFDDGLESPQPGDVLPPLWHWVALPEWPGASGTGRDGHPHVPGSVHGVGMPRRVFAGGSAEFAAPLVVGDDVRREHRVLSVVEKAGRRGDFVLVESEIRLFASSGVLAVREIQQLIYRAETQPRRVEQRPALDVVPALLSAAEDGWVFRTDPTKLMRFSAATSNSHRIHYDLAYATEREGYPGLVVHGPLMTLSLLEVIRLQGLGDVRAVSHRNTAPLFCGAEAAITSERSGDLVTLSLVSDAGVHVSVQVQLD